MPRTTAYSAIAFEASLAETELDITDVSYRSARPGSAPLARISAVPASAAVDALLGRAIDLLGDLLGHAGEKGNGALLVSMEAQLARPLPMTRSNDNNVSNSLDLDMHGASRLSPADAYEELAAARKCFLA